MYVTSCHQHKHLAARHIHPTATGSSVEPREFSDALLSSAQALPLPPSASPTDSVPANLPPSPPPPSESNMSGGALPTCRAAGTTVTSPLLLLHTGSSLLLGVVAVEAGAEPEAAASPSPLCGQHSLGPAGEAAAAAKALPEGADDSMPAKGDDMTRSDTGGAACM